MKKKTNIVIKLKFSNGDKNSKTKIVTKLTNLSFFNSKTLKKSTTLKNFKCDKTQQLKWRQKHKLKL